MSFPHRPNRRAFLKNIPPAVAASLSVLPNTAAADTPPTAKIEPNLDPKPAVVEKLAALKPNTGVLLGKVSVAVRNFTTFAAVVHLGRDHLIAVSNRVELLREGLLSVSVVALRDRLQFRQAPTDWMNPTQSGFFWNPSPLHRVCINEPCRIGIE